MPLVAAVTARSCGNSSYPSTSTSLPAARATAVHLRRSDGVATHRMPARADRAHSVGVRAASRPL